ncbi:MAG: tyrosine-type recombinase/integrase [Flavobacteriales bacterium]
MELINKFKEYLELEKRYSIHTVKNYIADVLECSLFFEINEIFPLKVTHQDIRGYIIFLAEKEYSSASINRKLSSLRSFYKYLMKIGVISKSPLNLIDPIKNSKKVQVPISKKEMSFLLDSQETFKHDFEGLRDLLIMELLYQTGIRKIELINLNKWDIDFSKKIIKVVGKRNKERIIPLTNTLIRIVTKYLEYSEQLEEKDQEALILTKKGKRIYPSLVYQVVNYYLSLVTTKDKKSPHMLRHSFATHLLDSGADLNAIKELMGHSSLASTQVYTNSSLKELKKMYNHTHPRSIKK